MFKIFVAFENIEINGEYIFISTNDEIISSTPAEVLDINDNLSTLDFLIQNNYNHKIISEIVENYLAKI